MPVGDQKLSPSSLDRGTKNLTEKQNKLKRKRIKILISTRKPQWNLSTVTYAYLTN